MVQEMDDTGGTVEENRELPYTWKMAGGLGNVTPSFWEAKATQAAPRVGGVPLQLPCPLAADTRATLALVAQHDTFVDSPSEGGRGKTTLSCE